MDTSTQDFSFVCPAETGYVHIRFQGKFAGKRVNWNAMIMTLAHVCREQPKGAHKDKTAGLRQFIEVGETTGDRRDLVVGLNVSCIDEQVIRKTIIMIRQYKRLREGRHEYGDIYSPGQNA